MPQPARAPSVAIAALVAGLALAGAGSVPLRAQGDPPPAEGLAYRLVETWESRPPPLYQAWEWPTGQVAGGLGHDPARDRVVVTDTSGHTLRIYDLRDGALLATLGGRGFGPGQFNAPRDADFLPDGSIAVSDFGNNRVQVLREDGTAVASWPVNAPQGLEVVRDWVYVVSRGDRRIYATDARGAAQRTIELAGKLNAPEGLAYRGDFAGGVVPPYATFAVADPASAQIAAARDGSQQVVALVGNVPGVQAGTVWTERGAQYGLVGLPGAGLAITRADGERLAGIAFDAVSDIELLPDGRLLAATAPAGPVLVPDLAYVLNQATSTFGRLLQPRHVAAGAGELLLGDAAPRLQVWSQDGRPLRDTPFVQVGAPDADPQGLPLPEEDLAGPADLAADGANHYLLWRSGRIRRVEAGRATAEWEPTPGEASWLVALDAGGGRVVALDLARQAVRVFDAELRPIGTWPIGQGGFSGAADIALAGDRVYLVDRHAYQLGIWTLEGAPIGSQAMAGRPERVAAGPEGGALVLSRAGWVLAFDRAGQARGAWSVATGDERPSDLAMDAQGRLYVTDAAGAIRVYSRDPEAVPGLPQLGGAGECGAIAHKSAAPARVELGETVEVQLVVDGSCPTDDETVDVVLTIDRSGSMYGSKILSAKAAAIGFVVNLEGPRSRIGVTTFSTAAERVQGLSEDRGLAIQGIAAVAASGSTNLVAGLAEARRSFADAASRPLSRKVLVFLSDGRHATGTPSLDDLSDEIAAARAAHIDIYSIGLGADADRETLRRMAADPSQFYYAPEADELAEIYAQIAGRIGAGPLFREITVVDVVPPNMSYLPGTGRPVEPEYDAATRTLRWRLGEVLEPGFRLSYRLRPEAGGLWPTNVEAHTEHQDGRRRAGRLDFPVPYVRVNAPSPTPSATAEPLPSPSATPTASPTASFTPTATPSPTASPTPTRTPTFTPTATATPTPTPAPIYLPLAVVDRCQPRTRKADIVLVLDSSSSMAFPTRIGGTTKLDAAIAAARSFVGLLNLPQERVAVVHFDDAAVLLQGLTGERAALDAALGRVTMRAGTRIDAGLVAAAGILAGPDRRADAAPVVVLLTDGRPSRSSAADVIIAAERLKARGTTLFTVGLGPDVDPALLQVIATNAGHYFFAPGTEDLGRVYGTIATKIPCPRSWP